jgi:hypothetical protein
LFYGEEEFAEALDHMEKKKMHALIAGIHDLK